MLVIKIQVLQCKFKTFDWYGQREWTQIDSREETNLRQMREQTSKVENSTYLFNVLNHFIRIIRKKFEMFQVIVKKIVATIFSLLIKKQG